MNAPLEPVHSPYGGSVAARILRCPASVHLVEKIPAHLRKSSSYAERGTALHTAMARLIENECSLDDLVGAKIGDYVVVDDDVELALRPVYAYVDALLNEPGAAYYLEQRVEFPAVAGAFGTADLIVRIGGTARLLDYKFGSGVRVRALTPDGDEDVLNTQLLFYGAGARHTLREFFLGVETVALTILQPQSIELDAELVSSVVVTHAELDEFIVAYSAACAEALAPAPGMERGSWCQFCPAQPICPEHTKPLLDLAQFEIPAPSAANYSQLLARGLDLVNAVKDLGKALHDQAKLVLQNGGNVEGYTLSAGRAERHWHDEAAAINALTDLGLARDDLIAETMRSPRQVELRAKARSLKVPPELIASHRSGVSLVRSENVRVPVRRRDEIARSFAVALEEFQQGDDHEG